MQQQTILQMLGGATQSPQTASIGQIRQLVDKIKTLKDPQALVQQMMEQRNPYFAKAMEYTQQHGGDPKAAFEALAKERGIDPAEITSLLG